MQEIVLATNNSGKVTELKALLSDFGIMVTPQSVFKVPEVAETGLSFVENAILKARNAAHHTSLPAIADDSGLEVDALSGAPGIYSARYAGVGVSDRENLEKLLKELNDLPEQKRTARFQCLLVYLRHSRDPVPLICQGAWEGFIALAPRGNYGFGYDPIFFVPSQGMTAAELDSATKNRLSHRAKALAQLRQALARNRYPFNT